MHTSTDDAIMIDTRAGIDDRSVADTYTNIDDGTGGEKNALAKLSVAADDGGGVDDRRRLETEVANCFEKT